MEVQLDGLKEGDPMRVKKTIVLGVLMKRVLLISAAPKALPATFPTWEETAGVQTLNRDGTDLPPPRRPDPTATSTPTRPPQWLLPSGRITSLPM
jgi:hypothetical protein